MCAILYVIFISLLILLWSVYEYTIKPLSYWKKRNVLCSKYAKPVFGNTWKWMLKKISFMDSYIEFYNEYPNESFNGLLNFNQRSLLVRDVEIIENICVKDFDYFMDHKHHPTLDLDPLFFKNLIQLTGDQWKQMRAALSPAFAGSRMKEMFILISKCAHKFTENFRYSGIVDADVKDIFSRFTSDVIATCAFGVKCDSIKNRENEFYKKVKNVANYEGFTLTKLLFLTSHPKLFKFLGWNIFEPSSSSFFFDIIRNTMGNRMKSKVVRPDMLHLLMDLKNGKLKHDDQKEDQTDPGFAAVEESGIGKRVLGQNGITDIDIASQTFIFIFGGFKTSSTILSFMANELAINVEVQEKLHKEIDEVMSKCNGRPNYEHVVGMKYLDMVVSETLRKWPPTPVIDRECTKEYKMQGNGRSLTLKVGDNITIPIIGFHRDERYFPEPDKFDPERFSDENRKRIIPYSYIPFGVGPRACIASRFALLEIKVLFVHLLHKFQLLVTEKTSAPIKLCMSTIGSQPDGGFWVGMKQRRHN